jgi:hypothetical protein
MTEKWWIAAFSAAIGLMSGLLAGLVGRRVEEWLYRPWLLVELLEEPGFRTKAKWKREDGTEVEEVYIRARVKNTRSRVATKCRPYLVKLEQVHPSGTITPSFFDSVGLPWPLWDHTPRDIPKGVNQFFDVVRTRKDKPGWHFMWREPFTNLAGLSNHQGTYRFTVLVTGDGVTPDGCTIDVYYDGKNWQSLKALSATRFPRLRWWNIPWRWRDWRNRRRSR